MLLSFTVLVSVFVVCFLPPSAIDLSSSGSVEFHWGTLGIVGIPAGVHVWVSSWHHAFPPSSGLISPQALTHWGFLYALCLCFCSTVFPANIRLSALFPFFLLSNCHAWHARLVACSCWVGQKLEALFPSALLLSPSLLEKEIIACVISNYSPSLFSPVSVGTRSVSVQALISCGLPLAFHCILELMCCESPGMICSAVFN